MKREENTDSELDRLSTVSTAEAYLAVLKQRGIDYFFVGSGTDTAPIVEAYAKDGAAQGYPEPMAISYESVAIGMAHGYYMATGRPQAVMLHVSVGAANAVCGLINAARAQVPIFFTAGRTPLFEHGEPGARDSPIHWAQEMFDQASMVREVVKWDYELRDGRNVADVVDRGLSIAMTHPRGPVYLTLPREVLARPTPRIAASASPAQVSGPSPDRSAVQLLARRLVDAKFPVISCSMTGSDPACMDLLVELSNRFGIPVNENKPRYVGFPGTHPLHAGYDVDQALFDKADAVLFLDCDVPWIPSLAKPADSCFVAHAGADPIYSRYPLRSFRSDLTMTSMSAPLLRELIDALADAGAEAVAAQRRREAEPFCAALRQAATSRREEDAGRGGPISKLFLASCLSQLADENTVLVNEYSLVRDQVQIDRTDGFYNFPMSGGLGWGVPAALGVKLARPEKNVICLVGDGAFIFANPAACHHTSAMHGLPILTIVFNNGGWDAVQRATSAVYPGQNAAAWQRKNGMAPLSALGPLPAFEEYSRASGGFGECVTERDQLLPALRRALKSIQEGKQALLNVIGK